MQEAWCFLKEIFVSAATERSRHAEEKTGKKAGQKVKREVKDRFFRFLIYLAEEYQKLAQCAENSLYGTKLIELPTPQCIVFYNGEREMAEEKLLRLSDAFENKRHGVDVELKVRMLNIDHGHNEALMKKCRVLKEYAEFIEISRRHIAQCGDRNVALNQAIDDCIEQGILSEFLRMNRAEVLGMLLEEFDEKKYERTIREKGREEERMNAIARILRAGTSKDQLIVFGYTEEEIEKVENMLCINS